MLGAIVGDLAAWTHENNKECFYSSLTSSDAKFSPLGEVAFATARRRPRFYQMDLFSHRSVS